MFGKIALAHSIQAKTPSQKIFVFGIWGRFTKKSAAHLLEEITEAAKVL